MSAQWERTAGPKARPVRHFTGALAELREEDLAFFSDRFDIPEYLSEQHIRIAPDSGRYGLPIYGPTGEWRGLVLRTPWRGAPLTPIGSWPKADTFKSTFEPLQSHYYAEHRAAREYRDPSIVTPLVIVEDQLSAIKLSAYGYDSVALLGVPDTRASGYSGADRVMEIARRAKDGPVIIALDSDATEAAFLFARKWGYAFHSIRVAILARDLKDTPAEQFGQILGDRP